LLLKTRKKVWTSIQQRRTVSSLSSPVRDKSQSSHAIGYVPRTTMSKEPSELIRLTKHNRSASTSDEPPLSPRAPAAAPKSPRSERSEPPLASSVSSFSSSIKLLTGRTKQSDDAVATPKIPRNNTIARLQQQSDEGMASAVASRVSTAYGLVEKVEQTKLFFVVCLTVWCCRCGSQREWETSHSMLCW
jgi:hypothetical protein